MKNSLPFHTKGLGIITFSDINGKHNVRTIVYIVVSVSERPERRIKASSQGNTCFIMTLLEKGG